MDEKIIEVRHIGNQNEPRFEIWLREITIDKPLNGISTVISENFRKVAVAVNVTEPSKWPVPVKKETNLQKSINWLFEDYNLYQSELNSQRAKHIKQSLYDWGENVFFQIFSNKEILAFYAMLQKERKGCIHIISAYADILSWPWEAVFSFDTSPIGSVLTIERKYVLENEKEYAKVDKSNYYSLKILLVTAREPDDIDYRLIANPMCMLDNLDVNMLRPPTIEKLKNELASNSYDVLHFDCHGGFETLDNDFPEPFIKLEKDGFSYQDIRIKELLEALCENCPRIVVLNACRSAMSVRQNLHSTDSIATKLLAIPNVTDVVAMAYKLHIKSAKYFFGKFYNCLMSGIDVPNAVVNGQKNMILNYSGISSMGLYTSIPDWLIPISYSKWSSSPFEVNDKVIKYNPDLDSVVPKSYFVGRDEYFYVLDRLSDYGYPLFLIYGLQGQGKTAFVKEYLFWRSKTGDHRPVIHLDFEELNGIEQITHAFNSQLIVPAKPGLKSDDLLNYVITSIEHGEYWIFWDHLHILNITLNNKIDFYYQIKLVLVRVLNAIIKSKCILLAVSRKAEEWLGKDIKLFPLNGLSEADQKKLFELYFEEKKIKINDYHELLTYLEGHPMCLKESIHLAVEDISPLIVLDKLKYEVKDLIQSFENKIDVTKFLELQKILGNTYVECVIPFIMMHERVIDINLLTMMIRKLYGDKDVLITNAALEIFSDFGLLSQQTFLHPLLTGYLRGNSTVYTDHYEIFVQTLIETIKELRILNEENQEFFDRRINVSKGTFLVAFNTCLHFKWNEEAEFFIPIIINIGLSKKEYEGTLKFLLKVHKYFIDQGNLVEGYKYALQAIDIACFAQMETAARAWLDCAKAIIKEQKKISVRKTDNIILLFREAKVNHLEGRYAKAKSLLLEANKLNINYLGKDLLEWSHIEIERLTTNDFTNFLKPDHIDFQDEFLDEFNASGRFNLRAQKKILEDELDEARLLLRRAIREGKKNDDQFNIGRSIQLLAELELKSHNIKIAYGNFETAAEIFESISSYKEAGINFHAMAKILAEKAKVEESAQYFKHAATSFIKANDDEMTKSVEIDFDLTFQYLGKDEKGFLKMNWPNKDRFINLNYKS